MAYFSKTFECQEIPRQGNKSEDPDSGWLKEAYKQALDIRKFEIDLYWKRATYFWTLIGAAFVGFVALANDGKHPRLVFLVSCIGVVLSTGWYFVNRGSKYWQENWERHVDVLENKMAGPLYKTTIAREGFRWRRFWQGYPYSVSRINQLISLFVAMVWVGLAIGSFPGPNLLDEFRTASSWILAVGTALFVMLLALLGKSRLEGKPRVISFRASSLGDSRPTNREGNAEPAELGDPCSPKEP